MNYKLKLSKKKRLQFTSPYNVKLYKKCLSLKLFFKDPLNYIQPNLVVLKQPKEELAKDLPTKSSKEFTLLKCFYRRNERVAFRLLRFFYLVNFNIGLLKYGVRFLVTQKLSVYNGKHSKFININTGELEVIMKCGLTYGDLIFTRVPCIFQRKIKLKKKAKEKKKAKKK